MDTVVKSLKCQPAEGYLSLAVCRISEKPWKPTDNCAFILGPALSGQLWMQNFKQDSFRIIQNPLPKLRSHSGKLSILYPVKKLGSQFKSMFLHFFLPQEKSLRIQFRCELSQQLLNILGLYHRLVFWLVWAVFVFFLCDSRLQLFCFCFCWWNRVVW